jgi:hypothetical protein
MVATRGCGRRQHGGIYLTCGLSPYGKPVEHFLIDPPLAIDPRLGISPVGVSIIERPDQPPHVFDWVGSENYPNVVDFVEEVRAHGMSRRAPKNLDFKKLQVGSRQVLMHARAIIKDPRAYQRDRMGNEEGYHWCPKRPNVEEHRPLRYEGMCAGLWWEDVEGAQQAGPFATHFPRSVTRTIGETEYHGWVRPPGVRPQYEGGMFMSLPITKIEVVSDPNAGTHEAALERLRGVNLEVALVPE